MEKVVEFALRFGEQRLEITGKYRHPAVVVVEEGGGGCNKSGRPSCRDFCAVPSGKFYNPSLDPPLEMLLQLFPQIARLKPAIVSLVPNGEGVDTRGPSNTKWSEVFVLKNQDHLSTKQALALDKYYVDSYHFPIIRRPQLMKPAEKLAIKIALAANAGLNVSLTTNGTLLTRELLQLYKHMGLQTINISYHPNEPFQPAKYNADLEYLIMRANDAIAEGITPTITHVLTSKNASTFVALADYVTEQDIFFAVGIANGRGGSFSKDNVSIEPDEAQVKQVFRRLLARKFFADRNIRTTTPYLLLAPYLSHWVCDQTTDFFHISIEKVDGILQPKLNVCSEVRPHGTIQLEHFLNGGELNIPEYLKWRREAMQDPQNGCPTCTHQCYFEAESRDGIDLLNPDPIVAWDYWDTAGKALRLRHTFRHPIRPTVSSKRDFQNPYLWESLLQGITRQVAKLASDEYWQKTFQRSGKDYEALLASCIHDAFDQNIVHKLVETEEKDFLIHSWTRKTAVDGKVTLIPSLSQNWHDANYRQSKFFRKTYLLFQRSGQKGLALPLKFAHFLRHEAKKDFTDGIATAISEQKRVKPGTAIHGKTGVIFPKLVQFLFRFSQPQALSFQPTFHLHRLLALLG